MTIHCDAVYENGVFRPVGTESLPYYEGQAIKLSLDSVGREDIMELAKHFYDGMSENEIDGIEAIILDRSHFYSEK